MIIGPDFFDRDLDGRPVRSWWIRGTQPEHVVYMRRLVDAYRSAYPIRQLAVRIIAGCPAKAKLCHALKIGRWVQAKVDYVNEGTETFSTPLRTLRQGYEDCDGHTILVCSLLEAVGIPSQIVALAWRGSFKHVFPRAVIQVRGRALTLPLDTTLRQPAGSVNPIRLAVERGDDPSILVM